MEALVFFVKLFFVLMAWELAFCYFLYRADRPILNPSIHPEPQDHCDHCQQPFPVYMLDERKGEVLCRQCKNASYAGEPSPPLQLPLFN